MRFSLAFAVSTLLSATTLASPIPEAAPDASLAKRSYGVYICDKPNWSGTCNHYYPPYNQCQNYLAFTGLTGLGAFGPDSGTVCLWYNADNCGGTSSDYTYYPGWADVPAYWKFHTLGSSVDWDPVLANTPVQA
ncbi:hypothetical protein K440DRAFT_657300 [Wilcoxina mikolae CBS 423.85]|nr:hypothetical protein K440DRAFT_657300 [Wilcoxina mikolae CBS 423.85]